MHNRYHSVRFPFFPIIFEKTQGAKRPRGIWKVSLTHQMQLQISFIAEVLHRNFVFFQPRAKGFPNLFYHPY